MNRLLGLPSNSSFEEQEDIENLMPLVNLKVKGERQVLTPEDVASDVLTRVIEPDVEIINTGTCLRTISKPPAGGRQVCSDLLNPLLSFVRQHSSPLNSISHVSPKARHKSPINRQFRQDRDSWKFVRKCRSTALPATIISGSWSRGGTASTPEIKVDQQRFYQEFPSRQDLQFHGRNFSVVRSSGYYNAHLVYLILNCVVLVAGLLHLGAATVFAIYKQTILTIAKYEIYLLSIICLGTVSLLLFILSTTGLCFVHRSPKTAASYAACSLIFAALMVALASVESTAQMSVLNDTGRNMLYSIKFHQMHSKLIWDGFHRTFRCCGVRSYLDWCEKQELDSTINKSVADDFLGLFTCKLPVSCCMGEEMEPMEDILQKVSRFKVIPCTLSPTPWNTYQSGCLTLIKVEIYYLGKLYRILCFATATVLFLSTIAAVYLYTRF